MFNFIFTKCHQPGEEEEVNICLDKFQDYQQRAEVYYAYHTLHRFTEQPFSQHLPDAIFNMARFLLHHTLQETPYGTLHRSTLSH